MEERLGKLLVDLRGTWGDKKLRSAREGRDFFTGSIIGVG